MGIDLAEKLGESWAKSGGISSFEAPLLRPIYYLNAFFKRHEPPPLLESAIVPISRPLSDFLVFRQYKKDKSIKKLFLFHSVLKSMKMQLASILYFRNSTDNSSTPLARKKFYNHYFRCQTDVNAFYPPFFYFFFQGIISCMCRTNI